MCRNLNTNVPITQDSWTKATRNSQNDAHGCIPPPLPPLYTSDIRSFLTSHPSFWSNPLNKPPPPPAGPHPRHQSPFDPEPGHGRVHVVWRAVRRRLEALPTAAVQGGQTWERLDASTGTYSCGDPSTPGWRGFWARRGYGMGSPWSEAGTRWREVEDGLWVDTA